MSSALVVSRYFPFNPHRIHAVYQRLGTQIEALAQVTDRVDCLFLVPPEQQRTPAEITEQQTQLAALWSAELSVRLAPVAQEAQPRGRWQRLGKGVFDFGAHPIARPLRNDGARAALREALTTKPRLILAHRLSSMWLLAELRALLRGIPIFFDIDDVEHVAWSRRLWHDPSWPAERLLLLQTPALMFAERRAVRLSTATFVCSEADRRRLNSLSGTDRVHTIPNSVIFPPQAAGRTSEALVMFVGSMGSRPNAQAVDTLVQEVWPLVRARAPQARLAIIGKGSELTASYPPVDPSVRFLGFVDDLDSWYARARIVCCPISHGSGTRVKIIEAAAHARAIVSTSMGAEGLNFRDGREILLREGPSALADACVELLNDPSRADHLGSAARARAAERYERSAVVRQLAGIFRAAASQGLRGLPS
jgi:glycosyltransferase involved in cell wall biosynthesis